ncbi:phage tail protein [Ensifer sp.]|uniref:phage tail protein n=1 Tax=Ensifer sp. TaxID=1872086 RepID=UPI00289C96A8|nr:phage tail protein [Ensifer sp.]
MAYETFIPPLGVGPSPGSGEDYTPRVRRADFGDGYSQKSPDGLNSINTTFAFQAENLTRLEGKAMIDFFRDKRGCIPFLWHKPGEPAPTQWVAAKWSRTYTGPMSCNITATFDEDFSRG